jgi:hypothetical protein
MTAFDAALSDSAVSNQDASAPASDRGLPDKAPSGNGHRAESYRQLWGPPGRRPVHRQALGQPYVWAGGGQAGQHVRDDWPDEPDRHDRVQRPDQAESPRWPERSRRPRGMLPAPVGSVPALAAAPAPDQRHDVAWPATADSRTSAAYRASILPAGPIRHGRSWPADGDERAGRPSVRAELEYSARPRGYPLSPAGAVPERAVIGDLLRVPMAWCQSGTCINWFGDPDALGEVDVRGRAVEAGWCADVLGRMICPSCQQRYHVWSARPPVPWTGRAASPERREPRQAGTAGRHRWR